MDPKISPRFWTDPDIEPLNSDQKLAVLWIRTNVHTTLCGFCRVSIRRFAFETGLDESVLLGVFDALPRALKHFPDENLIYIRGFIREQFGDGDQLTDNKIFKSVMSCFRGITFEPLREAILEDYPVIAEKIKTYIPREERSNLASPTLKQAILERDENRCLFEDKVCPPEELAIDHLVPRAAGGKTVPDNLFAVQSRLNFLKGDRSLEEFCKREGYDLDGIRRRAAERASKPLHPPNEGGREGERERAGEGVSSREEESEGKPHPPGMPKDKQQAVQWASMQAVPAEYASTVWEQIEGIGFIDGNNRRIVNWRSYISSRYSRQKTVAVEGQKKLSVMDLKSIIQIKEEKAKAIKEKYATEGAISTDWDNQAKREEWLALRKEIKELKSEIERRA